MGNARCQQRLGAVEPGAPKGRDGIAQICPMGDSVASLMGEILVEQHNEWQVTAMSAERLTGKGMSFVEHARDATQ